MLVLLNLVTLSILTEWDDKEEGKETTQQWEDDWDDDDVNDDFSMELKKELESNTEKSSNHFEWYFCLILRQMNHVLVLKNPPDLVKIDNLIAGLEKRSV